MNIPFYVILHIMNFTAMQPNVESGNSTNKKATRRLPFDFLI